MVPVSKQLVTLVIEAGDSIVAALRRVHLTFRLAVRKRTALAAVISFLNYK